MDPIVLADGLPFPSRVQLDASDGHVYFSCQQGSVHRVARAGGPLETLASGSAGAFCATADASHVYWVTLASVSEVLRVPKAGGPVEQVARSSSAEFFALTSKSVLLTTFGGTLYEVPKEGGNPVPLLEGYGCAGTPLVDGDVVFSATSGSLLLSLRPGCGDPTVLCSVEGRPTYLAADAQYLYWGSPQEEQIGRVPKVGGRPEVLVRGGARGRFAVHGNRVFYASPEQHEVRWVNVHSGAGDALARSPWPYAIAVDGDGFAYWSCWGGRGVRAVGAIRKARCP